MLVDWSDHRINLRGDGSAFNAAQASLWVADLHLGKDASFRSAGVPVPAGPTNHTLGKLAAAVGACAAKRLIIVGDMVHNHASWSDSTVLAWRRWREQFSEVEVVLVRGNHDRGADRWPGDLGITQVGESWQQGGVAFCHEPCAKAEQPTVCGHLHPGYSVRERGGGRLLAGCFWIQPAQLVLPAFGAFTGYGRISPQPGDRVAMLIDDDVWEVPAAMLRPMSKN